MRYLPCLVLVLAAASCDRQNANAVPDRGGHAWVLEGGDTGGGAAASGEMRAPPGPGERELTLGADEQLWMVADRYGQDLYGLIRRNDFTRRPEPGDPIIVPDREPVPLR